MAFMERMQIKLLNLLLAVPLFGLASAALAAHIRYEQFVAEMRAQGHFVCGLGNPGLIPCALLGLAAALVIFGRYWIAGAVLIPAAYVGGPWLLCSFFT